MEAVMTLGAEPTIDRLTCIVPAYNEGARIGAVLTVLSAHPLIDRIIVVDDGSVDDTLAIARRCKGAEIIALETNGGKTRALAQGLARATSAYVLLNDSVISHGLRLAVIAWPSVDSPLKSQKQGFWNGIGSDIRMIVDLLATAGAFRLVSQIVRMRRLRSGSLE
jgi:glycosyltransferase involved in cell wall biosynthesis